MRDKVVQLFEAAGIPEMTESQPQDPSQDLFASSEDFLDDSDTMMTPKQRELLPKLIQNCSIILRIISSDEHVHVEDFEQLCLETNLMLVDDFSFMHLYPTVHAVLGHSASIIGKMEAED